MERSRSIETSHVEIIEGQYKKTSGSETPLKSILSHKRNNVDRNRSMRFVSLDETSAEQSLNQSFLCKSKILDDHTSRSNRKSSLRKLSSIISQGKRAPSEEQTRQLFQQGIFEVNPSSKASESFNIPSKLPPLTQLKTTGLSPCARYISTKPLKKKPRTLFESDCYFADKQRLLEKLDKNSSKERWDLQAHLRKVMHENTEINRLLRKQSKATSIGDGFRSRSVPKPRSMANDSIKDNSVLSKDSIVIEEKPCLIFNLPKKNKSINEPEAIKFVSRSQLHSQRSTVFEFKDLPPASFLEDVSKVQKKLNGWKRPYTILNKRLKRKFVRNQLESLNASLDQP